MHAKDDPRLMRFRDGFWFSREILKREHAELEALRLKLSPESMDDAVHAVATAWQIVDVVHRVRDLADGVPGVNKKAGSRTHAFLRATTIAERFRHYVQHLRGEVSKPEVDRFPVWGALSWVSAADERTLHTTFLGVMQPGTEFHAGVYDAQEDRWVSRVSLSVGRVHFNVDPIVAETTAFCDYVLSAIDETQPGLPPVAVLHPFSTRFVAPDDSDLAVAVQAMPRALPKAMVEEIERLASSEGTTAGALVTDAVRAWDAARPPIESVPESVEAACSGLPEGARMIIRRVYRAVAWWLGTRKGGATQPPSAAEVIEDDR